MKLSDIQRYLENEGFTTLFKEANGETPLDQLLVLLNLEAQDVQLVLELVYIPDLEDELDNVKLLQFFVVLASELTDEAIVQLSRALPQINLNLPLMAFGLHQEDRIAYFRYVHVLSKAGSAQDMQVITETTWLVYYLVDRFYPQLAAAAAPR